MAGSFLLARLRVLADQHPQIFRPIRRPALALLHRFGNRDAKSQMHVIDRLAALLVEDPLIRVNEFGGEFYLDVRSALLRRLITDSQYEPELTRLCSQHCDPDRDVLDIGANVGFHAVLFGKRLRSGKVLSVEPTTRAYERLVRNIKHNQVQERVLTYKGAVSDQAGELEIHSIVGQEEYSSLGALVHPGIRGADAATETVAVTTVDEIAEHHNLNPGFMKIDVEGFEHMVLRGSKRILAEARPVLLAEVSDPLLRANGSSAQEVVDIIAAYDYEISDPLRPQAKPGTREFGDILCLPR